MYRPPPKSLKEIEAEAEQFQRDNPGWEAVVDDHGNTFYTNPYINNGQGNTQKPTQYIITQAARLLAEAKVKSREIDLVCVVSGHSFCNKEKIHLPPNVCVLTLSLLGDSLMSAHGHVTREVKELVEKSLSSSLPVSSFIDMAKKNRDDKKTVYPQKVSGGSIRARCGSENPKEQSRVTNQHFFGGTKTAEETEGIFMVEFPEREKYLAIEKYLARNLELVQEGMPPMPPMPPLDVDISSKVTPGGASLLTRQPHGDNPTPSGKNEYTYKKTTKFQERIIQLESGNPDETVTSSVEYNEELAKLYEQRSLFCRSLNFGEDFRSCIESCKGIDVMFLQHCYDCIVNWERKYGTCAHEYFTQVDPSSQVRPGLEHFIVENSLPDEEKTRKALMMISEKRKLQREKFVDGVPQNIQYEFLYDNQLVQSLYLAKTCESIVQDLHRMFPERKILVILDGCRVTYENREPYASDHGEEDDDELFNEGEGGAKRKNKKKTHKKKTYKKKTYKKKTYKKKTHKKKINSFKNKK